MYILCSKISPTYHHLQNKGGNTTARAKVKSHKTAWNCTGETSILTVSES